MVSSPVSGTVAAFVDAALAWASSGADADAIRLIDSPLAPLPHVDACAIAVGARRIGAGVCETIRRGTVALHADARDGALQFVRALDRIAAAYRAQGASAAEVYAEMVFAFDLLAAPRAHELAGLEAIADAVRAFDSQRASGPWETSALRAHLAATLEIERVGELPEPVPAAVVEPEKPNALPPRRNHWSASSLNTFAECERKWYFRYVCAAVEDRGSSASFYGTAFHAALEAFHERYPRVEGTTHDELARRLEGDVNTAFDRHRLRFESQVEFDLQRRRAQRTAKRYLRWLLDRSARAPFTVIGCEVEAELVIDGFAFVGYIDRLDRDDRTGAVTVLDYKTGSIATSAAEYRENVARFADFQLPFYYWARTAAGDRVHALALVPLKDALLDVEPVELEVVAFDRPSSKHGATGTISVGELERARARMIEICRHLSSGTVAHFPATTDPDACRYCAYAASCRERPGNGDRRFGR